MFPLVDETLSVKFFPSMNFLLMFITRQFLCYSSSSYDEERTSVFTMSYRNSLKTLHDGVASAKRCFNSFNL